MATKIAPYNNAMRLGQGFNSYTHRLCIDNAVNVNNTEYELGDTKKQSQVVSYSSRFVSKLSEVVETMNISLSSAIKRGTVEISGNSTVVDEDTFSTADLNAVVSVKVVNQTTVVKEEPQFSLLENLTITDDRFNTVYGDCYISGFIYGGELTGIVSVRVLDRKSVSKTVNTIKSIIAGGESEDDDSLVFRDVLSNEKSSQVSQAMKNTETTITVNWMGGGEIKQPDQSWDLDTLFAVASKFSTSVALCPQRTWAILTPYTSNKSFQKEVLKQTTSPKTLRYDIISGFTAELFDNFMEYKRLLKRIQDMVRRPSTYQQKTGTDVIPLDMVTLVSVRSALRDEQSKIVEAIEILSRKPSALARTTPWSQTKSDAIKKIIEKAIGKENAAWTPTLDMLAPETDTTSGANPPATNPPAAPAAPFKFESLVPPEIWDNLLPELKPNSGTSIILPGGSLGSSPGFPGGDGTQIIRSPQEWQTLINEQITRANNAEAATKAAETKLDAANGTINELRAAANTAKAEADRLNQAIADAQAEGRRNTDAAQAKANEYLTWGRGQEAQVRSTQNSLNDVARISEERNQYIQRLEAAHPDVNVTCAMWGPEPPAPLGGDGGVVGAIQQQVRNGARTVFGNHIFNGKDTASGRKKYGYIVYQKRGQGIKIKSGWEGEALNYD